MDKQQVLKGLIEMAEKEIHTGEIMLGYYEGKIKATKDKKDKAQIELRTEPIKRSVATNKEMLEYFKQCA